MRCDRTVAPTAGSRSHSVMEGGAAAVAGLGCRTALCPSPEIAPAAAGG